jgi:hypothetical protein
MEKLTIEQITDLQKKHNIYPLQEMINSGKVWEDHLGATCAIPQ